MQTIGVVFEAWICGEMEKPDSVEMEKVYAEFRNLTEALNGTLASDLWDVMTMCQRKAAEDAFTAGYRLGYKLHEELEG